jgi:RND family efflux transporter MFP subunit
MQHLIQPNGQWGRRPSRSPRRLAAAVALPLLAPLLVSLLVAGCGGEDLAAPSAAGSELVPAVEAAPARSGTLPLVERLSGVVKARNQVAIRPEIGAPVVEVLVENGETVQHGQPLVRLEDATPREQLRQAEAAARLAEAAAREAEARVAELEARVKRTRALAEDELVSRLELDTQEARLDAAEASAAQAHARVEQARATVEERRAAVAKAVVRAPVAGRVGQRGVEVGLQVDPGTVLFLIGDLDQVRVEIPLTEGMLGYIDEGLPVEITSEALAGEPIRAELSRISPFLEEGSFSTVGEIDIDNRDRRLRPGMFVTADVLYGESERATLIPASALWKDPRSGVEGVFVVGSMEGVAPPQDAAPSPDTGPMPSEPHPVELRPVEVLAEGRGTLGVRGVAPGEWVVTLGQQLLTGEEELTARVRPVAWGRVLELQGLQREDLLRGFLERQRETARTRGAAIPSLEEYLGSGGPTEPPEPATTPASRP